MLANLVSFAQLDPHYTDTIIVVKDPHVITKQVYLESDLDTSNEAFNWQIEAYYLSGGVSVLARNPETLLSSFNSNLVGLQVFKTYKTFELGLGFGIFTTQFTQETTTKEQIDFQKDSTYMKVLDAYIQTIDNVDSIIYVTESADTVLRKTNSQTRVKTGSIKFSYLQIPLSIGYRLNIWHKRLFFTPRAQLIFGLRTQLKTDFEESMHKFIYNYGFQAELSYAIFRNLEVKAKANWQSNISRPFYGEEKASNWSWLQFGMGLGYSF